MCTPCQPLMVIAHRGASGYVPEHTLGSYALAITLDADYVKVDLCMTKDGHPVACHDNELNSTTDVSEHPEFEGYHRPQTIDGQQLTGWFTEDFSLEELKTLRVKERIPDIRPGNVRLNKVFNIPTLQEIIDLVKSMQSSQERIIGICVEIKHSTHFKRLGLPIEDLLVKTLHEKGYHGPDAPVIIQSTEVTNLIELKNLTDLRLWQLYETDKSLQPQDQIDQGTNLTYGDMATVEGLQEVAEYASAVGPEKCYIIPRNADDTLGDPTSFVQDAHTAGLEVYPYTFRAENYFLPDDFRSADAEDSAIGDFSGEIKAYLATGIDGLFSDHPDYPARLRHPCLW